MTIFRIILSIIGITGITWFSLPIITSGIINIGNCVGISVFTVIFIYGTFFSRINRLLISIWNNIFGKVLLSVLSVALLLCLTIVTIESSLMIGANFRTPKNGDTVIVLGCKVNGTTASLMLKERLDSAYEFLIDNPDSVCILSGGKGDGENISEAQCMYDYLTEKGISQQRLYMEDKSTSTRENLAFSKIIIDTLGLSNNIALATNEFHMYRAGKIAQELELNYSSITAHTAWWLFPTYYFRELFGIMYQWFL